jgi:hypothetical protein
VRWIWRHMIPILADACRISSSFLTDIVVERVRRERLDRAKQGSIHAPDRRNTFTTVTFHVVL